MRAQRNQRRSPTAYFGADRFVLRTSDDSMIDAGIPDKQKVVLRKQDTARPGDVVVALIDRQLATLKRLGECTSDFVELIPDNETMQAMFYPASRVSIQGVVVGIFQEN